MIVADSDVLIDFMRGVEPAAARVALELESKSFATTAVTAFEIRCGCKSDRQQRVVDDLLDAMNILSVGSAEIEAAAKIFIDLQARGEGIGMADCLIAGVCIARDAVLLTRNVKHFERVSQLKLGRLTVDSGT
jgi:tRNA(fMet)-specific endonuclease VapC